MILHDEIKDDAERPSLWQQWLQAAGSADIAAGRLVQPFDIALPSPYAYFMVTAEAVARRAAVAAFRRWLLAEAAAARPATMTAAF